MRKKQLNRPFNLLPGQKSHSNREKLSQVTNFVCFLGRLCMTWTILPGGYSCRWSPVDADGQSPNPLVLNVSEAALVINRSNIWPLHSAKGLTILHYKPDQQTKCMSSDNRHHSTVPLGRRFTHMDNLQTHYMYKDNSKLISRELLHRTKNILIGDLTLCHASLKDLDAHAYKVRPFWQQSPS